MTKTSNAVIKKLNIIVGDFVNYQLPNGALKLMRIDEISQTGTVYGHDVNENEVSVRAWRITSNHKQ